MTAPLTLIGPRRRAPAGMPAGAVQAAPAGGPRKARGDHRPGPGPAALKEMRNLVRDVPGKPRLSQQQMAIETGIENKSSYQYLEDDYAGDYFDLPTVERLMRPLVERGIPPGEAKRKLLGDPSPRLAFLPEETSREVPVLARTAVGAIARGEIDVADITGIASLPVSTLRRWERMGLIAGWEPLAAANASVLFFDVADGKRVAVDTADRALAEGKCYVLGTGPGRNAFVLATWRDGAMVADGDEAVPYDPAADFLLGRVVWFLIPG